MAPSLCTFGKSFLGTWILEHVAQTVGHMLLKNWHAFFWEDALDIRKVMHPWLRREIILKIWTPWNRIWRGRLLKSSHKFWNFPDRASCVLNYDRVVTALLASGNRLCAAFIIRDISCFIYTSSLSGMSPLEPLPASFPLFLDLCVLFLHLDPTLHHDLVC
jgi:hypothetical protein